MQSGNVGIGSSPWRRIRCIMSLEVLKVLCWLRLGNCTRNLILRRHSCGLCWDGDIVGMGIALILE